MSLEDVRKFEADQIAQTNSKLGHKAENGEGEKEGDLETRLAETVVLDE